MIILVFCKCKLCAIFEHISKKPTYKSSHILSVMLQWMEGLSISLALGMDNNEKITLSMVYVHSYFEEFLSENLIWLGIVVKNSRCFMYSSCLATKISSCSHSQLQWSHAGIPINAIASVFAKKYLWNAPTSRLKLHLSNSNRFDCIDSLHFAQVTRDTVSAINEQRETWKTNYNKCCNNYTKQAVWLV